MRVLLLNPPYIPRFSRSQRSPAVTRSGTIYFPMWLSYSAGLLRERGHQVRLLDAPAKGYDVTRTVTEVREFVPRVVVLDTSTPSVNNDLRIAGVIKGVCPKALVILVGTHVSALPGQVMASSPWVDVIAVGEYDETLADLVKAVEMGRSLSSVDGIVFRSGDGEIIANQLRPLIKDLDTLPMVSRTYLDNLDFKDYFNPNALFPMVAFVTGRGCPNRCGFCLYPATMFGRRYRFRTIKSVLDEFEFVTRNFPGVRSIFLEDDTFTANSARCLELAQGIMERGITIPWVANSRADVDIKVLKALKSAGLRSLCVGFESGSQAVLDAVGKGLTVEGARRFAHDAASVGIRVHGCFIFGLPGETTETIEETIKFSLTLPLDTAQFYPLMVYPGTECYDWANRGGYLTTQDFSRWLTRSGYHNCVISRGVLTPRFLVAQCNRARRSFYLRPSYIASKAVDVLKDPDQRTRLFKAFKTFWAHLAGLRKG